MVGIIKANYESLKLHLFDGLDIYEVRSSFSLSFLTHLTVLRLFESVRDLFFRVSISVSP